MLKNNYGTNMCMRGEKEAELKNMLSVWLLQSINGVTVADDNSQSDGQPSTTSQHTVI